MNHIHYGNKEKIWIYKDTNIKEMSTPFWIKTKMVYPNPFNRAKTVEIVKQSIIRNGQIEIINREIKQISKQINKKRTI